MKNKTLDIKIKRLAGALLAFAGVACLPYIWNLDGKSLIISNSWFGVFLWGVLWYLKDRSMDDNVTLSGRKTEKGGKRTAAGKAAGSGCRAVSLFLFFMPGLRYFAGAEGECSVWQWDDVVVHSGMGGYLYPLDL